MANQVSIVTLQDGWNAGTPRHEGNHTNGMYSRLQPFSSTLFFFCGLIWVKGGVEYSTLTLPVSERASAGAWAWHGMVDEEGVVGGGCGLAEK